MAQKYEPSDLNLELFRHGDPGAFEVIFKQFYRPLCYFANDVLRNSADAENVVMDTFVKLWRKRMDFYAHEKIKAFLYITTKNACFNQERHKKAKLLNEYSIIQTIETVSEKTALQKLIQTELISEIYNQIELLPERRKLVFKMAYIDELKNEEIAEKLELSIHTVKEHKGKALATLRYLFTGSYLKSDWKKIPND